MQLCKINSAVITIMNKTGKKKLTFTDVLVFNECVRQLREWLVECENIIENKENNNETD